MPNPVDRSAPCRTGRQAGFSLVELMIVLVIMGATAGIVVLALPDGRPGVDTEAEDFAATLDRIARDAILSNRFIGVRVDPRGFAVFRLRRGRWEALEGSDASGTWSPDTLVTFGQSGTPAARPTRTAATAPAPVMPQIRFDPIGTGQAFWVRFERAGVRVVVRAGADGLIRVEGEDNV